MMNLKNRIQQDLIKALKSHEREKIEVLRFLMSQIKNLEIEQKRKELTDQQVVSLIQKQLKNLEEDLQYFVKGERKDLINKNKKEAEILKIYLPSQLSEKDLEKEIDKIIQENPTVSQPGPLIGLCVKNFAGKADNRKVVEIVMQKMKVG